MMVKLRMTAFKPCFPGRHLGVIRVIAIFFLIYTGGDILLPQYFCAGEEIGGLPLTIHFSADTVRQSDGARYVSFRAADGSESGQPQQHERQDEDCFCCCAHVLPGFGITGAMSFQPGRLSVTTVLNSLPSPPLPHTYRPPRFV
jgi:hypothetical protein